MTESLWRHRELLGASGRCRRCISSNGLLRSCAVLCLTTALAAQDAAPSIAEKAIVLILNAPAAANTVWPGFSLHERNWLIYDSTGAYLVTQSTPPPLFEAKGRWFFRAGVLPGLDGTLNWAYRLGDLTVTAIPAGKSPEATASSLYHEAFHAFQDERFGVPQGSAVQSGNVGRELTAGLAASIEIERRALREAIRAKGRDETSIRQALAIREQRAATSSGALLAAERTAEQREGLAQYVEEHSIALARRRSARAPIDAIVEHLKLPLRTAAGSPDERLIRVRAYGTGAAMGVLLDRLGLEWKLEAQAEALDRLLAARITLPAEGTSKLVADAYRRYGHDALLTSKDPPWGELRVFDEREFDALAPYRLVVEITQNVTMGWNVSSAAGRPSGMHRPSPGVLLLPFADRFTAQAAGLSVVVTGRSVRLDSGSSPSTFAILLPQAPRVNGEVVAAGLDVTLSSLRIETDGVLVTMATPVRVTAESHQLRVAPR